MIHEHHRSLAAGILYIWRSGTYPHPTQLWKRPSQTLSRVTYPTATSYIPQFPSQGLVVAKEHRPTEYLPNNHPIDPAPCGVPARCIHFRAFSASRDSNILSFNLQLSLHCAVHCFSFMLRTSHLLGLGLGLVTGVYLSRPRTIVHVSIVKWILCNLRQPALYCVCTKCSHFLLSTYARALLDYDHLHIVISCDVGMSDTYVLCMKLCISTPAFISLWM